MNVKEMFEIETLIFLLIFNKQTLPEIKKFLAKAQRAQSGKV